VRREALELLKAAQELVAERSHWTKRALARDRHGHPVEDLRSACVARRCGGAALITAALEAGIEVPGLPGERLWSRSPALELAFECLGRACGHELAPLAGLIYREDPRLAELVASEDEEALIEIGWAELVFAMNDLGAVRHRHLLAVFARARELAGESAGRRGTTA
jgi:hypothetical protein